MSIEVGGIYRLVAHWHKHHGKLIEVLEEREGITEAYAGKKVYHVAYDPFNDDRFEDFDEEFIDINFKECVLEDDIIMHEILSDFKVDLPEDLVDYVHKLKEEKDLNVYVYIYEGSLEVTFGRNEYEARELAFHYMRMTKTERLEIASENKESEE